MGDAGARGEQALPEVTVAREDVLTALHQPGVVDTPEHLELVGAHAAEKTVERAVVEARAIWSEKRSPVPLATDECKFLTPGQT